MSIFLSETALALAVRNFKPAELLDQDLLEEQVWDPTRYKMCPATIESTSYALTCLRAMAELESDAIPSVKLKYLELAITAWLGANWEGHSILSISTVVPRQESLLPPLEEAALQNWSKSVSPGNILR